MKSIEEVLRENRDRLMGLPGVFGVAVGSSEQGPCIELHASRVSDEFRRQVPTTIEGYAVRIREIDAPEAI